MKKPSLIFIGLFWVLGTGFLRADGSNPYGAGFIGIGAGYQPEIQLAGSGFGTLETNIGTIWGGQLSGGFPVSRFFGLDVSVVQAEGSVTASLEGTDYSDSESLSMSMGSLSLEFFPAAFAKNSYTPGHDSNPDGWLWWPSVTLGLQFENSFEASTLTTISGSESNSSSTQDFNGLLGITLPVATWLSVGVADTHNFVETGGGESGNSSIEQMDVNIKTYINLMRGAASDVNRPYIPSIGRLGQLEVGLDGELDENTAAGVTLNQTLTVSVAAPLSAGFALGVSVAGTDNVASEFNSAYMSYAYTLNLTYAFGNPAHREDR